MSRYAVIALQGKQYRVNEGEHFLVDRVAEDEGATVSARVLVTGDGGTLTEGGEVTVRVQEHLLGPKIRVFTYKPKRNSRRSRGHRSRLTRVLVEKIA